MNYQYEKVRLLYFDIFVFTSIGQTLRYNHKYLLYTVLNNCLLAFQLLQSEFKFL